MDDDAASADANGGRRDDDAEQAARRPEGQPAAPIDVERLAEKVYQLLRDEVRLGRARGGRRAASWGR